MTGPDDLREQGDGPGRSDVATNRVVPPLPERRFEGQRVPTGAGATRWEQHMKRALVLTVVVSTALTLSCLPAADAG